MNYVGKIKPNPFNKNARLTITRGSSVIEARFVKSESKPKKENFGYFWTGTKRMSRLKYIDEHGKTFNESEFTHKIGAKKIDNSGSFPISVQMTRNFKFQTNTYSNRSRFNCWHFEVKSYLSRV